jgi:hypothetical protein
MRRPLFPDSVPSLETHSYKSQTINLEPKFSFGHTFYEVEEGVISAAEKIAQILQAAEISPQGLKRNSGLMQQFSTLAILSQRVAGIRTESAATMQNQAGTDREAIIKIIDKFVPEVGAKKAKKMWDNRKS